MTALRSNLRNFLIKGILPVAAIIGVVLLTLFAVKAFLKPAQSHRHGTTGFVVKEGATVPDFGMFDLEGKEVRFKTIQKKIVLVNFWATWCEACVVELPSLGRLWRDYKDRGFDVIGINVDEEPLATVPSLVKKLQLEFPIYFDTGGKISDLIDVHGIPFTLILDKDNRILLLETGERDWNSKEVRAQLDQWLK